MTKGLRRVLNRISDTWFGGRPEKMSDRELIMLNDISYLLGVTEGMNNSYKWVSKKRVDTSS